MLIGVMGAIVTLLVVAGMVLMTPGNTEPVEDTAASRTRKPPSPPQAGAVEPEGSGSPSRMTVGAAGT